MAEIQPPLTPNAPPLSIGKASASGIMWTTVFSLGGRFSTFLSQLVLAKLLMPEDFGVVGLAYTISTLFSILTGFGIEQVFQQRRERMPMWATQAFVLSLGLAVAVAVAMAVYAPIGARLYHNEKVTALVWLAALGLPFNALCVVPQARLKSLMRFKFLAVYTAGEQLASQILTILLAWAGFGAVSFMLPVPLAAVIRAIVFWRTAPMVLRPLRYAKGWSHMMKRGVAAFGVNVLNTGIGQGDYATLGVLASAHVVGIYYFAFKIAAQPVMMLASNFTAVLRPALIAMNGDPERQRGAALKTARLLGLLTLPVCFMQAAVAGPGLQLMFGARWLESVPLIQILSLGLSLDAVSWAAGAFLEARGQFSKSFKYQLITAPFFFLLVGAGALLDSATGVAIGVTVYYTIHPVFLTTLVFHKHGIGMRRILACFYVPFLMGAATIGGAYALSRLAVFNGHFIAQITVIAAVGGSGYLLAVRQFAPDIYTEVRGKLSDFLRRK